MKYLSNIEKYDNLMYNNTICSVEDYVKSKLDDIHAKLFNDALEKWFNWFKAEIKKDKDNEDQDKKKYAELYEYINYELEDFLADFSMIENKGKEFFNPSKISLMQKKTPHIIIKVNLDKWWNTIQDEFLVKKNINDKLINEETKTYAEIVYIDYIRHKAKIRNRMTDEEYWIDNDYITPDLKVSDNFTLKNTFGEIIKNI